MIGTISWFLSEAVFKVHLPFWTQTFGWSLVFTNFLSLPLMNTVGLFLEESEEKDYLGIFSFILLSYITVPFQGYAAVKGLLERQEGPWFRTPKTGVITDIIQKARFYRWFGKFFPWGRPATVEVRSMNYELRIKDTKLLLNSHFKIHPPSIHFVGNLAFGVIIGVTVLLSILAPFIPAATSYASQPLLKTVGQIKEETKATNETKVTNVDSKNPPNKEEILKNAQAQEITTPRAITKTTKGGKNLEFIFHQEPRVRIKLGQPASADGFGEVNEVEFETKTIGGRRVSPQKSKILQDKEVTYEEVIKDVDLKYSVTNDLLVEEFIIKKRLEDWGIRELEIEQTLKTVDIKIVSPDSTTFGFYSDDGRELFKLSQPFAKDAKGEVTNNLTFTLDKEAVGYKLIKTLGDSAKAWLSDPARVYPVTIDPSVIVSGGIVETEVQFGGLQRKLVFIGIGFDAASSSTCSPCTSLTFQHTVTTGGSNRIIVVGVATTYATDVTGVTYAGVAMDFIGAASVAAQINVEMYQKTNPATGSNNVVASFAQSTDAAAGATSFTGVHQTTPTGTFASATGSGTAPSVNVTSAADEVVIDTVGNNSGATATVGAGQTERWNQPIPGLVTGAGSTEPGASSVTMSWTLSSSINWAIGAVPLKPAAVGIGFDAASSSTCSPCTSLTFQHTVTTGGSNRIIVVGVATTYATDVTGVTYAGVAMDFIGAASVAAQINVEMYQKTNPATGSNNVVASFAQSTDAAAGATSFTGVHQTTPTGTFASATGSGTAPSVNVTSAADEVVIDTVGNNSGATATVGAGQTERWNQPIPGLVTGAGSTEPGASSVTMSWTLSSSINWAIGAVPLKPAASGGWYAFYNDATDVWYKKSSDGVSWGSAVDIDPTDANNYNPSVFLSGNLIYVAWIDISAGIEVNSINTASSDALGTKCTQSPGTVSSTYMISVAVATNGTVYLATTDTNAGSVAKVYKLVFSGCTFTDITSAPTAHTKFYLPSSGTAPAITPTYASGWDNTTIASRLPMAGTKASTTMTTVSFTGTVSTDQDILFRQYISAPIAAQTISAQTVSIQMRQSETSTSNNLFEAWLIKVVSNDGTTLRGTIAYGSTANDPRRDATELATALTNRGDSLASTQVVAQSGDRLVLEVGYGGDPTLTAVHSGSISIGDDNATDLPVDDSTTTAYNPWISFTNTISYNGSGLTAGDRPVLVTIGNNLHLIYQDGDLSHSVYDGTGWTTSNTQIANVTDNIYSVTTDGTSLWVLTVSGTTATNFYKCASCPAQSPTWSSLTVPWSSQTNVTSVSITYDSTNTRLYAHIIKDTSEQAYFRDTDKTTISWGTEYSYGFTAGDLGHISSNMTGAGATQIGVVLRQGSNFEFAVVPEKTLFLLAIVPFLPKALKKLKKTGSDKFKKFRNG
jgi:hypothetical protein